MKTFKSAVQLVITLAIAAVVFQIAASVVSHRFPVKRLHYICVGDNPEDRNYGKCEPINPDPNAEPAG